jgi:hypothetical protein
VTSADVEEIEPETGNVKMYVYKLRFSRDSQSNANHGNTNNRAGEEKEDQEQEDGIVDGEDLSGHREDVVDRLEDLDVREDVSTTCLYSISIAW